MGSARRDWRGDAAGRGDGQSSRRVRGGSRRPGLYVSAEAYAGEVKAAGGVLDDGRVAVDIGLLRFDAELDGGADRACRIQEPARGRSLRSDYARADGPMDSRRETRALFWWELARILRAPERLADFHCAVVEGEFIHAGTTRSFRSLASVPGGVLDSVIGECIARSGMRR